MSYADNIMRRRGEWRDAFRKRYNPAEDVLAELQKIDKDTKAEERAAAVEERAKASEARTASKAIADEERAKAAEDRAAGLHAFNIEDRQRKVETEDAERKRKIEADEAERKRKAAGDVRADVKSRIAGQRRAGMSDDEILASAREDPAMADMNDDVIGSIMAELDKIDEETGRKNAEAAQKRAESAAKIKKMEAEADKARRGPSPEALADRAQKKRIADLQEQKLTDEVTGTKAAREAAADKAKRAEAAEEKKQTQLVEVDNFVANIVDGLNNMRRQIQDTGTFELTGPESENMERWLTDVATNMAKLADPGSVAREGEVALAKKGLIPTGTAALGMSNATAIKIIDAALADVEKKRQNAYRVRQITPPNIAAPSAPAAAPAKRTTVEEDLSNPKLGLEIVR
jgi:hypothetical protein